MIKKVLPPPAKSENINSVRCFVNPESDNSRNNSASTGSVNTNPIPINGEVNNEQSRSSYTSYSATEYNNASTDCSKSDNNKKGSLWTELWQDIKDMFDDGDEYTPVETQRKVSWWDALVFELRREYNK